MPRRLPLAVYLIAALALAVQIAGHGRYDYFRDELYYLACSHHLAWGYVDQPPLSLAILAATRTVLGDGLHAIRLPAALAVTLTILLAAAMARRMGGGRFAQVLAAAGVAASHLVLGNGGTFSMNAFDLLLWAAACTVAVRILTGGDPRLWLAFGLVVGLGLENKYSIGFLVLGLVGGLALTAQRRHLASRWFWGGTAVAALLFLPHVAWEVRQGFPSLEFMRNASQEKNVPLSPLAFFAGQLRDMNILNAPIWLLGVGALLGWTWLRPLRALGWAYLIIFALMAAGHAKVYYLAPVYPVLLAAGATAWEHVTAARGRRWLRPAHLVSLALVAILIAPFALPLLPVDTFIRYQARLGLAPHAEENTTLGVLPQHYADMFGWRGLTALVADATAQLTPAERQQCIVYVRNYGEAAALEFFGRDGSVPPVLCAHNSYWFWGPGERRGDVVLVLGVGRDRAASRADLEAYFDSVTYFGETSHPYAMPYENHRPLFICRGMHASFPDIWAEEKHFI